ncbi:MAG TPA: hypothetical protein PK264_05255 [Hyphomicrobiaceae bacterium]|nr:hypothetical protein [Hyphomicrobiaceae bacterium]
MPTKNEPKNRPQFRVCFARKTGVDDKGGDVLGSAQQIGSVWSRSGGRGSILRFDHIPIELTQHNGVLFLFPTESDNDERKGY